MEGVDTEADDTARLRAATRTAESLAELLRELERHADSMRASTDEIAQRARQTETAAAELQSFKAELRQSALDGVDAADAPGMCDLIDALVQKPNDLLVMLKISEQAARLAAIVRAHGRVLEILRDGDRDVGEK